jgi:hypothetical protein
MASGLGLALSSTVCATDSESDGATPPVSTFSVSPISARLQLTPGVVTDGTFKVSNPGTAELAFKVYATPYYVSNDNYDNPKFSGETNRTQVSRWISFDQTEYTLAPGASVQVNYHVTVPASVPAGGQYAAIMVEDMPATVEGGISASSRIGIYVFSSIAGTTIEMGVILGNSINGWYYNSPIETSVSVKNDGNTDFAVATTLKIFNIFGGEIHDSGVKNYNILPETSRSISLNWESGTHFGLYTVQQNVKFLNYDETYTRVVLLMPVWLLLIVVVLVSVAIALIVIRIQKGISKNPLKRRITSTK